MEEWLWRLAKSQRRPSDDRAHRHGRRSPGDDRGEPPCALARWGSICVRICGCTVSACRSTCDCTPIPCDSGRRLGRGQVQFERAEHVVGHHRVSILVVITRNDGHIRSVLVLVNIIALPLQRRQNGGGKPGMGLRRSGIIGAGEMSFTQSLRGGDTYLV
ncbi:hypothetical protein BDZ97DRAFT_761049 [Flammula alnicola]|nr:hypothetical protein BDZ97DRAFT_761049 [Flammula alnicola]